MGLEADSESGSVLACSLDDEASILDLIQSIVIYFYMQRTYIARPREFLSTWVNRGIGYDIPCTALDTPITSIQVIVVV